MIRECSEKQKKKTKYFLKTKKNSYQKMIEQFRTRERYQKVLPEVY